MTKQEESVTVSNQRTLGEAEDAPLPTAKHRAMIFIQNSEPSTTPDEAGGAFEYMLRN